VGEAEVLVTVDQIADGVHFRLADTPIGKIGRKAVTRNLSDVAAMGALPVGAVAAACLPRGWGEDRATALFDALRTTAAAYDCPLFGGDVAMWDNPLLISVTVLARTGGVPALLRRGALAGDAICVTGELGGSLEPWEGRLKHLDFEPRLRVARLLASDRFFRPHAMIDISDGLGRDLGHICRASGVAAELRAAALPISPAAIALAERTGLQPWQHALADGEDYELCFAVAPDAPLPTEIDGVAITKIGVVTAAPAEARKPLVFIRTPEDVLQPVDGGGWEHTG
jgi:thiamine-monophosphate kinase